MEIPKHVLAIGQSAHEDSIDCIFNFRVTKKPEAWETQIVRSVKRCAARTVSGRAVVEWNTDWQPAPPAMQDVTLCYEFQPV